MTNERQWENLKVKVNQPRGLKANTEWWEMRNKKLKIKQNRKKEIHSEKNY